MSHRVARLDWPTDVFEERTAIVPVPLSPSRERERGFNQSEILARHLAQRWTIPLWTDAVVRVRSTVSQTQLTPDERLANVAGAFAVRERSLPLLRRAHILLVDDVVTTGATLASCATALFEAGARTVSYATFGRAPASGDRLQP